MLSHLADLASDFSAIHRTGDISALPAATFLALATRLPAYPGVMAARVAARDGQAPGGGPGTAPPPGVEMVQATRAGLQSAPELAGIFSFGTGGG